MTSLENQKLKEAAINGDVEFLKNHNFSNQQQLIQYYSTIFPEENDADHFGNIFHLAAQENKEDFIREAIKTLPLKLTQNFLLQQQGKEYNWNPLHYAAFVGNVEVVKMFLDLYRGNLQPSDHSERPWLQKDGYGDTPYHVTYHEECAIEILEMDMESICKMLDYRGSYIIYEALHAKFTKILLKILRSPYFIGFTGFDGSTPFHSIHYLEFSDETQQIFRLLLQKDPELIKQKDNNNFSAFHLWAEDGKVWPFKLLLKSNDIIPNVKRVCVDLIVHTNNNGHNPFHSLAQSTPTEDVGVEMSEILIDVYNQGSSSASKDELPPWLVQDNDANTPLSMAIERRFQKLAIYILSMDENAVIKCQKNALFLAVQKQCHETSHKILKIIDNQGWTQLLMNDHHNILHLAPLCNKEFCIQLIDGHPEFLKGLNKEGATILHSWIKNSELWLFEFILKSKWRAPFIKLIDTMDYNDRNTPIHWASTSTSTDEATIQVLKLLVQAYKEDYPYWMVKGIRWLPWFVKNRGDQGPLHFAIRNKREELALYILSLHQADQIGELLEYYKPEHNTLFLAVQNNCTQVTKKIFSRLNKENWSKFLKDSSNGQNILHLAPTLKGKTCNEEFGTWLVNEATEFITEQDIDNQSPWDKAYDIGPAWFIKAVLKKDPLVFNRQPLAWINACKNGHVLALRAFIDHNPGAFRDLCIEHKNTPLHYIKLSSLSEYEEFLKIPRMKDLINLQDSRGVTPLHKPIRNGDLFLAETLLNMDKILYDINDDDNVSAVYLLAQECDKKQAWDRMCKRIGLDPRIKTAYFQHKTNLLDVRNSLFVVAALLATITFTAGFTLPGGFNQESGEAILAKKEAFLAFLVFDTLALFFSMLVLICLIWSMVYGSSSKSLVLIDRSMVLLRFALNCTLVLFMTGVYKVITPKSLWAAIFIIVSMSSLIMISVNKNLLYNVLEKLIPFANKKPRDRIRVVENGHQE